MAPPHTVRRIVSLQPSATVILAALGELERLVACTKYCADVVPEVRDGERLILHDSWTADAVQIVAAKPDLVIAAVPYQEKAVGEILKAGSRFLGLAPKTLADIYTDIATIAGVVSARARGEEIIQNMEREITGMREATTSLLRPRVFCEEWGKPIIASQPWVAELVEAAGGKFLSEPGKQISPADVLSFDPGVFIAAWCGAGIRVPLEKIVAERGWSGMAAAQQGRVFCISDELLNTPAPTLIDGLRALAAAIHPERFAAVPGLKQWENNPLSNSSD